MPFNLKTVIGATYFVGKKLKDAVELLCNNTALPIILKRLFSSPEFEQV